MNCDRANLSRCSYTHIRAEQPNAGGDDIVHLPLLKITAGIFPHQFDHEISREHLPIMRVAAKI